MNILLASFCNIPTPTSSPVLAIELPLGKDSKITPINIGSSNIVNTATGLAKGAGKVFIAYLSKNKFHISALDENTLETLFCQEFPNSKDTHSMLVDEDWLYTVSTGTDEIIRYKITNKDIRKPELVYAAGRDRAENNHINSIHKFNGNIIISGFGKSRMENAWRTAHDGFVFNVSKGIVLKDKIYQPHSVSSSGKELFYCESGYGKFFSTTSMISKLNGYTRGVQFLKNTAYVGTSIGRSKKKKSPIFYNPADYGKANGRCAIHKIDTNKRKVVGSLELGWFAPEIYDLLLLENSNVNLQKLFMSSFLEERRQLAKKIGEDKAVWNIIKEKIK